MPFTLKERIETEMALEKAGSVFAPSKQKPEWRKNLPSTFKSVLDAVDAVIGSMGPSPLDAGGGKEAQIKVGIALQRKLQEAYLVAPKVVRRAAEDARTVLIEHADWLPTNLSMKGYYRPSETMGLGGKPDFIAVSRYQGHNEKIKTLVHELTHFLTEPTLAAKPAMHAAETAEQVAALMPPSQELQWFAKYVLHTREKMKALTASIGKGQEIERKAANEAYDSALLSYSESLSYLNETLLTPHGNTKFLHNVANSLGVGIK